MDPSHSLIGALERPSPALANCPHAQPQRGHAQCKPPSCAGPASCLESCALAAIRCPSTRCNQTVQQQPQWTFSGVHLSSSRLSSLLIIASGPYATHIMSHRLCPQQSHTLKQTGPHGDYDHLNIECQHDTLSILNFSMGDGISQWVNTVSYWKNV
jgi:hypothetical protein